MPPLHTWPEEKLSGIAAINCLKTGNTSKNKIFIKGIATKTKSIYEWYKSRLQFKKIHFRLSLWNVNKIKPLCWAVELSVSLYFAEPVRGQIPIIISSFRFLF